MNREQRNFWLFLAGIMGVTVVTALAIFKEMLIGRNEIIPWLWISGFAVLFFNVAYTSGLALLSLFAKDSYLPEVFVKEFPRTALCYFVRNESKGLYERMLWSFGNSRIPGVSYWLLSDSDETEEPCEKDLIRRLESKLGRTIHYRRRQEPLERKQGNIREFVENHPEYDFLYICDADSLVPKGTLLKLIRKALHPANEDVAIFQTFIRTAHAKTLYAKFEGIASESSQSIYFKTIQAFFGRAISFGHQLLARRACLEQIRLPKGLLSHDNWDTALLDQMGLKVAYCPDVASFDEAPANYLEARAREARWAQGTLQGIPILSLKGLTEVTRFLAFYGIYCYLMQPVFLFWVLGGLFAQSFMMGELMSFKTDFAWFGFPMNATLLSILATSLFLVFFHKAVIVKTKDDLKRFAYEIFFSALIYSGNFLYASLDLFSLPFRKLIWRPMRKDPFEKISFSTAFEKLWLGTLTGALGCWYLLFGTPAPQWSLLPVLVSLAFSVPLVYFSAKVYA